MCPETTLVLFLVKHPMPVSKTAFVSIVNLYVWVLSVKDLKHRQSVNQDRQRRVLTVYFWYHFGVPKVCRCSRIVSSVGLRFVVTFLFGFMSCRYLFVFGGIKLQFRVIVFLFKKRNLDLFSLFL